VETVEQVEQVEQRRVRFRFSKMGKVRFTSHRDVARMWERALRRSRLPVGQSQGFTPHPLGELPYDELPGLLTPLLPEGVVVQAVGAVPMAEGSLQQEVGSCDWELEVYGVSGRELQEQVERVLAAPSLTIHRERKGRQTEDDIRPAILTLAVTHGNGSEQGEHPIGRLRAELATHPRGIRPGDLISALGTEVVLARACRTHQWIERDGARFEPLSVSGLGTDPVVVHAAGRAS
jgi:hypothetical protein